MIEKDEIKIYYKQAILNLFVFKKKPKESKTEEDCASKNYLEQIQEFKNLFEYYDHKWLKYFFLRDIVKWLTFISPICLLMIFGFTIYFIIIGLPVIFSLLIIGIICNNKSTIYRMEGRANWWFMNELMKEISQ